MALVQWNHKLETGHLKIDEQHKDLINALNTLHAAMKQGRGRDEVGRTLAFLRDYTVEHFRMEEELMRQSRYPGMAKHAGLHEDLVKKVVDLVSSFEAGTTTLTLPVMNFLEGWLVEHIQGEDFRLAEFLAKR